MRRIHFAAVAVVAAFVLVGCSGPTESSEYKSLQGDMSDVQDQLADAQAETEQAVADADSLEVDLRAEYDATYQDRQDELEATYQARRDQLTEENKKRSAALDRREGQLRSLGRELDAREDDIIVLEHQQARNQFTSGTILVGQDVDAGQYRAPGSSGCYWEFSTGTGSDASIIDNHFGPGQQYVTLNTGQVFKTDGCGTWNKVG